MTKDFYYSTAINEGVKLNGEQLTTFNRNDKENLILMMMRI